MIKKVFLVTEDSGLHARPVTHLVHEAGKYICDVTVSAFEKEIDLKSIMGIMSLGVYSGEIFTLSCDGVDEKEAMQGLTDLILELKLGMEQK